MLTDASEECVSSVSRVEDGDKHSSKTAVNIYRATQHKVPEGSNLDVEYCLHENIFKC
jgi:hypothetical protein